MEENAEKVEPINENALYGGAGDDFVDNQTTDKPAGEDGEGQKKPDEGKPNEGNPPRETPIGDSVADEYWSVLKEYLGEEFVIPEIIAKGVNEKGEKVTPKEKLSLLQQTILDSTMFGNNEDDDAFVRNYMRESVKENFDRKKFLSQYTEENNFLNLPTDKFMFNVYKQEYGITDDNKDGMTDEEIQQLLDKKDPIELKAEHLRIKKQLVEREKIDQAKRIEKRNSDFISRVESDKEANNSLIKKYVDNIKDFNNIDGFEFGESDKRQYIESLPSFLEKKVYKTESGELVAYSKAEEILASFTIDPEKAMTLIPLLWMISENKLKGYTSSIKERAKRNVEDKLNPNKKEFGGSGESANNEINEEALFSNNY